MATTNSRVDSLLQRLTLDEKISLLSGQGRCKTTGIERLDIPALNMSDGPNGLRGYPFFNPNRGCLLPCGTAMGATFDVDLMRDVGQLLAGEALCRHISVILGPVVCLQRSPLIGRGFEAFGEDPLMSGLMSASYCAGVQEHGVASCIKHFFSHDQSSSSIEDNCIMTERTMREMQLLAFQLTIKYGKPWSLMSCYNKVNGIHVAENPKILQDVLRKDWGFDGLVMSDWYGTYSTSESLNAGMDLEMPGPTIWRGTLLENVIASRKVTLTTLDESVRNMLNLVEKVTPAVSKSKYDITANDTPKNRQFVRRVASESIVLLKNDASVLPLKPGKQAKFGLIGDHFQNAALAGGGSSEVDPYYRVQPYDAFIEEVGVENISTEIGCYSHRFQPVLSTQLTQTGSNKPGLFIEFFTENPESSPDAKPIYTTETTQSFMVFADSLPQPFPTLYYTRVTTTFTAPKTCKWRFGLSVSGKAKLMHKGSTIIDQWSSHPEKKLYDVSPMFNGLTMERFADFDITEGETLEFSFLLTNVGLEKLTGAPPAAGIRLGGCPVIDEDQSIAAAVDLAKSVDIPIVMTGLSSDYELENSDRRDLSLPSRCDELISRVIEANPKTIVVTQSGLSITMPWADKVSTIVHAWFGGQECGHGLTDVLFGRVNPSARLSVTFPKRLQDTPTYLTFGKVDHDIVYGEGVFLGYRYYERLDLEPQFYFGHGLSYTQFAYSELVVPSEFVAEINHEMTISVDVENVGELAGAEVVQVYISDPESKVQRPKKELKAFQKVWLEPAEKRTVTMKLDKYALSYWCQERGSWKAEEGRFEIVIAKSASPNAEVLRAGFTLSATFYWTGL